MEWRQRLSAAVLNDQFDKETLLDLIEAGWSQAHCEGLQDAADVCDGVARAPTISNERRRAAAVLASSIRELERLNRETRIKEVQ